jgi:hypothetical protein
MGLTVRGEGGGKKEEMEGERSEYEKLFLPLFYQQLNSKCQTLFFEQIFGKHTSLPP